MASWLVRSTPVVWSGFESPSGTLRCILMQDNLLSQRLSSLRGLGTGEFKAGGNLVMD